MLSPSQQRRQPAAGSSSDLELAVIGAGPHGLAAAVHLRRAGVGAHVFGEPMSFWHEMPRGMRLRSNQPASNLVAPQGPLSLAAYAAATGNVLQAPIALEDFIAYGEWVSAQAVPDVDRRLVATVTRERAGFALALTDGSTVRARRVVVAGGIAAFAHVPEGFDALGELATHSCAHTEPAALAGRRVAIVGGGQSACELAALIAEAGAAEVEVLVRAPAVVWLRGHSVKRALGRLGPLVYAPTDVGPLWYSRLVQCPGLFTRLPREAQDRIAARCIRPACAHFVRVRLGPVRLSLGVTVREAGRDGDTVALTLSDGTRREVDHVILATGYRVDVRRYPFLGQELRDALALARGYPVLGAGLQSSVPGLHFAGAPAAYSCGPIMRFVSGSWYGGATVARALGRGARRSLA